MEGRIFDLGEFKKKEGFFDLPFSFFPYKNNSIKIKLSNLQERNVCYV
jgi:hypothetical protein